MTFLAPMAGLIGAAVCLPLLIAVYLLRLRRRPVRVSSVMFWERAAQDVQANVPLRWLRPSVLLLLQLLALGSLLTALARPAIETDAPPARRLTLLIDASASMAAPGDDAGVTRLEEAKARASEIVDRAMRAGAGPGGDASRVAVISFASSANLETGFTGERRRALRAIEGIEQTDQPGDLASALRLASAQGSSPGEDGAGAGARVVLLSDGALDPSPGASVEGEFVFVRVGPAPAAERDNLGVAQISARRDYEDPALVRIFARIVNASGRAVEAPLTLRVGEEAVRAESVSVRPAGAEGPGEAPVAMRARLNAGALLTLAIERADDLASDNAVAVVMAPASRLRLLLVAPGGSGQGARAGEPDPFLASALETLEPQRLTRMSIEEYERRAADPAWAAQFSLIVFDRAEPDEPPPAPTLSFASTAGSSAIDLAPDEEGGSGAVRIVSWRRSHPVMRFVSLDALAMRNPPIIRPAPGAEGRVAPLAQSEAGPVVVLVTGGLAPRLIVSFPVSQSNWPVQLGFAVFIANAASALAPEAAGAPGRSFTTGEPVVVRAAAGVSSVRAVGPVRREAPVREGQREVSLGALPLAGVYRIEGAAAEDEVVAVNLASAGESAIATRDEAPVVGVGEAGRGVAAAAPREVWRWFVLLGFLFATLEWLLQAWRLRR